MVNSIDIVSNRMVVTINRMVEFKVIVLIQLELMLLLEMLEDIVIIIIIISSMVVCWVEYVMELFI